MSKDYSLKNFSVQELKDELERRAKEDSMPKPKIVIDWGPLQKYVQEGASSVAKEGYLPKDFEHYLYEMALEAVYGKEIWEWWNENRVE